jgi:hypothetical protein
MKPMPAGGIQQRRVGAHGPVHVREAENAPRPKQARGCLQQRLAKIGGVRAVGRYG